MQELLLEQKDKVVDYLIKSGGNMYVCGNAGLKKGVMQTLEVIFKEQFGNKTEMFKLIKAHRICFECFG